MSAVEMVLFESSDGVVTLPVEVDVSHGEVWLTQAQMSELFTRNVATISRHIKNAFEEGEVDRESNLRFLQIASSDRPVAFYSLDVIISVGYRVKSPRGVEFRRWATDVLRRYLTQGYAANERRLRELGQVVIIISRLPEGDMSMRQVLDIVQSYSGALDLLGGTNVDDNRTTPMEGIFMHDEVAFREATSPAVLPSGGARRCAWPSSSVARRERRRRWACRCSRAPARPRPPR